jgi:hypothetical protein
VPLLKSAESKWRVANLAAHEATNLARDLEVRSPSPRVMPLVIAQAAICRAVAAALADAGHDVEFAANISNWFSPRADTVITKLREKAEED